MTPSKERLGFIVRFLAMDLNRLRPPAWARLKKDIHTFIFADPGRIREKASMRWGIVARPPLHTPPEALTEKAIEDIQEAAKELVVFALKEERGVRGTTPVTISATYSLWSPGRSRFLYVVGAPQEVFLLILHILLARGADTQLRCCPECDKVFLRVGKQMYCGHRCKKRANMRAWRQTPEGRAARARAAKARYRRKRLQPAPGNVRTEKRGS